MHRKLRAIAFACAAFSLAAWVANALELTWLRPHACTEPRMQLESWLFIARAAAIVLLAVGLVAGLLSLKPWSRWSALSILSNALVITLVIVALAGQVHLPCLR